MTIKTSKSLSIFCGIISLLVGIIVLFGWFSHNANFIQILPNLVPMQFNTALGFLFFGIGALAFSINKNNKISLILAGLGGGIGLITLLEYIFKINIGLDELFMEHYITVETSHPGRMAPNTALCFVLCGFSVFFLNLRSISILKYGGIIGSLVFGLGLVALMGYAIGVESTYGWGAYTRMAVHTALSFMILGLGFSLLYWRKMKVISNDFGKEFSPWLLGYAIVYSITIFLIDEQFPLGFSADSAYIVLVLFGWFIKNPKSTIYLAISGSILIVLGYFVSIDGGIEPWMAIVNRASTVMLIWLVAILLYRIKTKEIQLRQKKDVLDIQFKEIKEKNEVLEEFTYIASHDLQEPLRTVSSFAEIISLEYGDKLDETGNTSIRFIMEATTRMSGLIRGLLDYSRLGRSEKLSKVDLNRIIDELQQDLSSLLKKTEVEINVEALPTIECYEMEMRLLFQNLITNGIKFAKKDVLPKITISSSFNSKSNNWEFKVSDNGIGIKEENKDKIFLIFKKLHNKSDYEGTGIGLAHCKKITNLHKGDIGVESVFGEGCSFHFTISNDLV